MLRIKANKIKHNLLLFNALIGKSTALLLRYSSLWMWYKLAFVTVRSYAMYAALFISWIFSIDSKLCQKDAILIHDGENASAMQLKAICGTKKKETTVRGPIMLVPPATTYNFLTSLSSRSKSRFTLISTELFNTLFRRSLPFILNSKRH